MRGTADAAVGTTHLTLRIWSPRPVLRGNFFGVEAVIDKDRTSALLAAELDADLLAIFTNVDQVQLDFGKPQARAIGRLAPPEARALMAEGQFSPGSTTAHEAARSTSRLS
jgi:carbamate kinase